jgi:hypothetical protein
VSYLNLKVSIICISKCYWERGRLSRKKKGMISIPRYDNLIIIKIIRREGREVITKKNWKRRGSEN